MRQFSLSQFVEDFSIRRSNSTVVSVWDGSCLEITFQWVQYCLLLLINVNILHKLHTADSYSPLNDKLIIASCSLHVSHIRQQLQWVTVGFLLLSFYNTLSVCPLLCSDSHLLLWCYICRCSTLRLLQVLLHIFCCYVFTAFTKLITVILYLLDILVSQKMLICF